MKMPLIDKAALTAEINAAVAATKGKKSTPEITADLLFVVVQHVTKRIAAANAALGKRQESTDELIADLDRRLADLERNRTAAF